MARPEGVTIRRFSALDQLDVLRGTYGSRPVTGHSHDDCTIGLIDQGAVTIRYGARRVVASPGDLVLLNPDEIHAFAPLSAGGWTCRMFYPSGGLLRRVLAEQADEVAQIQFPHAVTADPLLAGAVDRLLRALLAATVVVTCETQLAELVALLAHRYASPGPSLTRVGHEPRAVSATRAYLDAYHAQEVRLDDLAAVAHLSPFHLVRVFRAAVGIPPHAYLIQRRVRTARELLLAGHSIADAAVQVGFADQSHLTTHFRRIYGVPPGRYIQGSKNLQD